MCVCVRLCMCICAYVHAYVRLCARLCAACVQEHACESVCVAYVCRVYVCSACLSACRRAFMCLAIAPHFTPLRKIIPLTLYPSFSNIKHLHRLTRAFISSLTFFVVPCRAIQSPVFSSPEGFHILSSRASLSSVHAMFRRAVWKFAASSESYRDTTISNCHAGYETCHMGTLWGVIEE